MSCQKCKSELVVTVLSHCVDRFHAELKGMEYEGYVPSQLGIGSGDDVEISYCVACGQMQGDWPLEEDVVIDFFVESKMGVN